MRLLLVLTAVAVVTAIAGVMGLGAVQDGAADQLLGTPADAGAGGTTAAAGASPSPCVPTASATACNPTPSPLPTPALGVPYSHSWYIDSPDDMTRLGTGDAQWLTTQATRTGGTSVQRFPGQANPGKIPQTSAQTSCTADFLTVLDFGHPTRKFNGNDSPLDDYAMTLFGLPDAWRTYGDVEQLAEQYLDAWVAAASHCVQLHLVLGTSNFAECRDAVFACDVATAGQYWDVVVHDVMDYVAAKGYGSQVLAVWAGDDLETSWDPWETTASFLAGVQQQEATYSTHARMVDYGDAQPGLCSIVTGSCKHAWTAQNVYDAAWGFGWDVPLPETYGPATTQYWQDAANSMAGQDAMAFLGVMTECAGDDPLPTGSCHPQRQTEAGPVPGTGACQWSPTLAVTQVQPSDAGRNLAYATNIQWADPPAGDQTGGDDCT